MTRTLRILLVGFVFVVLQTSVFGQLSVWGARPDVILLATVAAALAAGPETGAGVGFGLGLCIDLLGSGPVGLTALVCTLVGYGVGSLHTGVVRSAVVIPLAVAGLASAAGVIGYALFGEVLGRSTLQLGNVVAIVVVVAVVNVAGCLPATRAMRWALVGHRRERTAW